MRPAPVGRAAISDHLDGRTALTEVQWSLLEDPVPQTDLLLVFGTYHHRTMFGEMCNTLAEATNAAHWLGTTTEAVTANEHTIEAEPGLSAMCLSLPEVSVRTTVVPPWSGVPTQHAQGVADLMGLHPGGAASIGFADPFSLPIQRMVDSLPDDLPGLWGGVASGASQPGHNVLVADGEVLDGGFVAAHLHGKVGVDGFVCPGVLPVGDLQVVTEVTKDAITSLGNRPVLAVLKEVLFGEPEERREWVKDGLLLGIAIDEHKRPLGRGDFLVRELLGVRPEKGQLVCGTPPKVGSTVRFHLRDSDAACEDLVMLLDAQQLKSPPPAALVFGCRTRGARLHGEPETDAIIVHSHLDKPAQAGCFMAAEFAPVDGRTRVHGHSVGVAPIRRTP